jgi:hypothetical protein
VTRFNGRGPQAAEDAAAEVLERLISTLTALHATGQIDSIRRTFDRLPAPKRTELFVGVIGHLATSMIEYGPTRLCPKCPACGAAPTFAMPSPTQRMCPNDDCDALMWNPTRSARDQLADAVDIEVVDRGAPE